MMTESIMTESIMTESIMNELMNRFLGESTHPPLIQQPLFIDCPLFPTAVN
jgi:hypothetical protein